MLKIVGFVFTALFIYLLIEEKKPVAALFVTFSAGVMILLLLVGQLSQVIEFIKNIAEKANIDIVYIGIIMKILAISYLATFAGELCEDAGARSLKGKVEFAGKILILVLAIPILMAVMNSILQIM